MKKIDSLRELPIIMFSMSRWDDISSASLSLAKELSKKCLVLYIDNPFTFKDIFSTSKRSHLNIRKDALLKGRNNYFNIDGYPKNLIFVVPRLTFPINWLKKGRLYNFVNKLNNHIVNQAVKKAIRDHKISDYILFNSFNPFYGKYIPKEYLPLIKIYQSRDNISAAPYVSKHGVDQEIEQIKKADFAFATSMELVKNLSLSSQTKVVYLPNAADTSIFNSVTSVDYDKPKELNGINDKRIIGYMGNIEARVDYELIKIISEFHADKILLLVGPNESANYASYDLHNLPNLIFVGKQKLDKLPQYLKFMDCTIIPFKLNELTKSIYPLKINEYLASGKPVVSTNFSEDVSNFKDIIYIADSYQEFISYIDKAIKDDNPTKHTERLNYAIKNDWARRVDQFWSIIEKNILLVDEDN